MFKTKLQKLENLANLVHNLFVNRKNIIVFIGSSGTYLSAISNSKCIDSLFIPLEEKSNIESYKYFFKKYNKFYIFFLYDDPSCELRHEVIPVLQSVVKVNVIEKFIDEHFLASDIIAYNIYNVITKNEEVWNTLIVKAPYQSPISDVMNYILESSFKFGGIYYLNLEYITIVDKILEKSGNIEFNNHLQIFAYITKANAIKFIVKYKNDIISIKSVEYPIDRTELYVQGIIEQEVSDYLISFKNYLLKNSLKVCMIFLVNDSLKALLQQSKFEPHAVLCISHNDGLNSSLGFRKDDFSDKVITELFASNKTFLASNKSIKSIIRINLINFLIFKPLSGLIAVLVIMLINTQLMNIKTTNSAEALDKQNFQIVEEYRNIKQKYPDIKNVANLADLYSLTALLKIPVLTPFEFTENFLNNLPSNIHLDKINWKLIDPDNIVQAKDYINIEISFKYITENKTMEESLTSLNSYVENLNKNMNNFSVKHTVTDKAINILNRIIIPTNLTIIGPKGL